MQSQFGAAKNPPWARQEFITPGGQTSMTPTTIGQGSSVMPGAVFNLGQQPQLQQSQFNAQQIQAQSLASAALPQPGIAIPTTLATSQVATISYPAPRPTPAQNIKQRVFTGTVTKLHDNFGFVDEDVFFQLTSVKGNMPKVGDRVLVEASYNANMPFKWNATRIQLLPNQTGQATLPAGNIMGTAGNLSNPAPIGATVLGNPNPNTIPLGNPNPSLAIANPNPNMSMGNPNPMPLGNPNPNLTLGNPNPNLTLGNPNPNLSLGNPNPNMSVGNAGVLGNLGNLATMAGGLGTQMKMGGQGLMQTPAPQNMASMAQAMVQAVSGMAQSPAAMAPVVSPMVAPSTLGLGGQQPALLGQGPGILQRPGMMGLGRFGGIKTERDRDRDRDRDMRDRSHRQEDRGVKRPRSPRKMRSHSPSNRRSRSPPRRRTPRIIPKYVVQFPRVSLDVKEANVIVLKSKYSNMYIPSDFFHSTLSWTEAFPLDRPFQLGNTCSFHIMAKETEPLTPNTAVFDPPDADHLYSAKVMLLASHSMEELLHKCAGLAEDLETKESFQHPTRLLNFLVGVRGKNEPMAIGGPWSPSLDGPDPRGNPQVLIKTAIRTTLALTGIDLGCCTQWYRFAEIHYLRPEGSHKGRQLPTRVETVVLFLPDIWTCSPTRSEWGTLKAAYAKQLQRKLAAVENKDEPSQEEEEMETEDGAPRKGPTHHSELDPKSMKIVDLRQELESRNLSAKGLKSQLIARLTKTLRSEQEKEEEEAEKQPAEENPPSQDEEENQDESPEEIKKREEEEERKKKEKRQLEKKYSLPENPAIIVHPSATAKSGKFDCTMMSLSVLLDYRPEDNKEHSFEVSLFAEMFNEMLIRDFGFKIYDAMMKAPPKKEEKKNDKKEKEKEKDKDKKKSDEKDKEKDKDKDGKKEKEKGEEETEKSAGEEKEEAMEEDEAEGDEEDEEEETKENGHSKKSSDSKDKEKEKEKKREKKKLVTKLPLLLLAFTYFDQNHTNYLLDKDLEDMFLTLGLHLSRAQIKKLMAKVTSRDTLHYRKLTDFPPDTEPPVEEKAAANFSLGNLEHLRGMRPRQASAPEKDSSEAEDSNFITFRGATVDVASLIERLNRSESSRNAAENKISQLLSENTSLKSTIEDGDARTQKLSGELQLVQCELERERQRFAASDTHSQHLVAALGQTMADLQQTITNIGAALAPVPAAAAAAAAAATAAAGTAASVKPEVKEEREEVQAKPEVKQEEPMEQQGEEEAI